MADNTTIQQGSGGDTIRTDAVVQPDGTTIVKTQVVKIGLGEAGADRGPVTISEPFPVRDRAVLFVLGEIRELLREILDELRAR